MHAWIAEQKHYHDWWGGVRAPETDVAFWHTERANVGILALAARRAWPQGIVLEEFRVRRSTTPRGRADLWVAFRDRQRVRAAYVEADIGYTHLGTPANRLGYAKRVLDEAIREARELRPDSREWPRARKIAAALYTVYARPKAADHDPERRAIGDWLRRDLLPGLGRRDLCRSHGLRDASWGWAVWFPQRPAMVGSRAKWLYLGSVLILQGVRARAHPDGNRPFDRHGSTRRTRAMIGPRGSASLSSSTVRNRPNRRALWSPDFPEMFQKARNARRLRQPAQLNDSARKSRLLISCLTPHLRIYERGDVCVI